MHGHMNIKFTHFLGRRCCQLVWRFNKYLPAFIRVLLHFSMFGNFLTQRIYYFQPRVVRFALRETALEFTAALATKIHYIVGLLLYTVHHAIA